MARMVRLLTVVAVLLRGTGMARCGGHAATDHHVRVPRLGRTGRDRDHQRHLLHRCDQGDLQRCHRHLQRRQPGNSPPPCRPRALTGSIKVTTPAGLPSPALRHSRVRPRCRSRRVCARRPVRSPSPAPPSEPTSWSTSTGMRPPSGSPAAMTTATSAPDQRRCRAMRTRGDRLDHRSRPAKRRQRPEAVPGPHQLGAGRVQRPQHAVQPLREHHRPRECQEPQAGLGGAGRRRPHAEPEHEHARGGAWRGVRGRR